MRYFAGAALALVTLARPALAQQQPEPVTIPEPAAQPEPAKQGEACTARTDCQSGLRCFQKVCVDERTFDVQHGEVGHAKEGEACGAHADCKAGLRCSKNACVAEQSFQSEREHERAPRVTLGKDQTFGYAGAAIGFSLPTIWGSGGEGFQLAARLGVVFGPVQLQLEVSPGSTALVNETPNALGLFDAVASIGFYIPLSDMVSWLIRFGGGGGFLFNVNNYYYCTTCGLTAGFGEFRFDVFGVGIRPSKHLLIELNVPSFRITTNVENSNNMIWMWVTSFGVDYVF